MVQFTPVPSRDRVAPYDVAESYEKTSSTFRWYRTLMPLLTVVVFQLNSLCERFGSPRDCATRFHHTVPAEALDVLTFEFLIAHEKMFDLNQGVPWKFFNRLDSRVGRISLGNGYY